MDILITLVIIQCIYIYIEAYNIVPYKETLLVSASQKIK